MPHDRILSCLVDGDPTVFRVTAPSDSDVLDLRKVVWQERKNRLFRHVDAADLILFKLNPPVALKPSRTLDARIRAASSNVAQELEEPTDTVSLHFPHPSANDLHIIVESPTDKGSKKRFKSLSGLFSGSKLSEPELDGLTELYGQIQLLSQEPEDYSDPNKVFDLPFPSANVVPARFSVSDKGSISYMGRECFLQVWDTFRKIMSDSRHRQAIYVYGSKGFGKSHIFAALACLLVRKGQRVVYLPDCCAMLLHPLTYLRTALVFAFADSKSSIHREDICKCENVESLADFCAQYRSIGQLCFIVDQLNALDLEPTGQDEVADKRKLWLRAILQRMSARHIEITSASANHKTFKHMAARDTGDRKIHLMGGMTPSEMSCWWQYYDFTAFSHADKQRIEDLTGRIPLLLTPFTTHPGEPLETLEPLIWRDEVLASIGRETIDFANVKKSELEHRTFHDQFVPLMRACLMGSPIAGSGMLIDHRYFYLDSNDCGRYSCGLAREAITEFLRKHGEERIFLGPEWLQTLEHYKDNPSAIGFTVEQIVISKIASTGVHSGNFNIPAAKIVTFEGGTTTLSKDEQLIYYVPLKFSLDQKENTAHVVAIQITVAKRHKDSQSAFFADLDMWLRGLVDFEVKTSFLWIHEGKRGRVDVEAKLTELRGRKVMHWPQHEVHWVSIEQVDEDLASTLAKIRPMVHPEASER